MAVYEILVLAHVVQKLCTGIGKVVGQGRVKSGGDGEIAIGSIGIGAEGSFGWRG